MHRLGEVARLDAGLASLARSETGLRLRLGQVLEVLGQGKYLELGFSSVAAYVLERCDRSVRWVEAARCLARRLESLPELRGAMAFGRVSWSMGELLARVARPRDEAGWIEAAKCRTVRQMRGRVLEALRNESVAGGAVLREHAALPGAPAAATSEHLESGDSDEMCTLTCTVDREEAWLFEATRALLEQLGVHGGDAQVEALLAEGQDTLLGALPSDALNLDRVAGGDTAQQEWVRELGRRRAEEEVLCEEHFRGSVVGSAAEPMRGSVANAAALGLASLESASCHDLDGRVRRLARSLARHELELSQLVLAFHRANGWRRLGYASETQYARERLGMSCSSLLARRALALRLEKLPRVAEALGAGQIGVEAAVQVARVATLSTQAAWVERARHRTLKHLREEVAAALVAVRMSGEVDCPPPVDGEMVAFHELEQAVVSGKACQPRPANDCPANDAPTKSELDGVRLEEPGSAPRRAWLVMLGSLAEWLEGGVRLSAASGRSSASNIRSKGRVELRLRVSRTQYAWWRALEAQARRWLPCGTSWLGFLCRSIWNAWRHLLGADVAYSRIYIRDRYQCSSPVCSRRDVTPHHLQFRSAGGSDADENVASVCTWCHLFGVHGGRIRAVGTADHIRWELGAADHPCLVVDGRERVAA
jgi:hypothetical protein